MMGYHKEQRKPSDPNFYPRIFDAWNKKNLEAVKAYGRGEIEFKDLPGAVIIISSDYERIEEMRK